MNNLTSTYAEKNSSTLAGTVLQCLLYIAISVLGILLNASVLWLVRTYKSLRTITNLWVSSLCSAQLLIASIIIPPVFISAAIGDWIFGQTFCQVYGYVSFVFRTVTILCVAAIALDRYHVVSRPFCPRTKKNKAKILIAFVWWASIIICFPPLFGIGSFSYSPTHHFCQVRWSLGGSALVYTSFYISAVFIATFLASCWSYILIYKITKLHSNKNKTAILTRSQSDNHLSIRGNHRVHDSTFKQKRMISFAPSAHPVPAPHPLHSNHKLSLDQKTIQIIIILLVVFVVAWAPYFSYAIYLASSGSRNFSLTSTKHWTEFLISWCSFVTCVFDPFLYAVYTKNFRSYFRKHFAFWNCHKKDISARIRAGKSSSYPSSNTIRAEAGKKTHLPTTSKPNFNLSGAENKSAKHCSTETEDVHQSFKSKREQACKRASTNAGFVKDNVQSSVNHLKEHSSDTSSLQRSGRKHCYGSTNQNKERNPHWFHTTLSRGRSKRNVVLSDFPVAFDEQPRVLHKRQSIPSVPAFAR